MRIVAGTFGGRLVSAPKGIATRPTSDRVREAVFSILTARLGHDLGAAGVLDAFAGSGALGLEALSRGAARAVFVERDPGALRALRANISALDVASRSTVVASDVLRAARRSALPGAPFSLLFLDPPYRIDEAEVRGLVEALSGFGALVSGTVIVWEHDAARPVAWPECVTPVTEKRYGSTAVSIGAYEEGGSA